MRATTYLPRLERKPELIDPPPETERFLTTLQTLENYPGGLSTEHLFKLVCPNAKDQADFAYLLQQGYHHSYIDRPLSLNHKKLIAEQIVSKIYDKGTKLLQERRRHSPYRLLPSNMPTHDYLNSCDVASIEIAAKKALCTLKTPSQILSRPQCPETTRHPLPPQGKKRALSPFDIPAPVSTTFTYEGETYTNFEPTKRVVTPDDLREIEYPSGATLGMFIERDRNTEDAFSTDKRKNSLLSKFLRYQYIFTKKDAEQFIFQKHFGFKAAKVFFIFDDEPQLRRFEHIALELSKLPKRLGGGPGASYIAMKRVPYHGHYQTPSVNEELFTGPWIVPGMGEYFIKG